MLIFKSADPTCGVYFIPLFTNDSKRIGSLLAALSKWLSSNSLDWLLDLSARHLVYNNVFPAALISDGPLAPEQQAALGAFQQLAAGEGESRQVLDLLFPQEQSLLWRTQALDARGIQDMGCFHSSVKDSLLSVSIYTDLVGRSVRLNPEQIFYHRGKDPSDLVVFTAASPDAGGTFTVTKFLNGAYILDRFLCTSRIRENELILLPDDETKA